MYKMESEPFNEYKGRNNELGRTMCSQAYHVKYHGTVTRNRSDISLRPGFDCISSFESSPQKSAVLIIDLLLTLDISVLNLARIPTS